MLFLGAFLIGRLVPELNSSLYWVVFKSFIFSHRLADWTHSLWTVCMMKEHTELPSSLFMEHQPRIHLRYKIHLLYLMVLLLLQQFKWQRWLNSSPIPLLHTQPTSNSNSNSNIWCLVHPILLGTQGLGHFLPTLLLLTLKITILLEAPAYCNDILEHLQNVILVVQLIFFLYFEASKAVWFLVSFPHHLIDYWFGAWIICLSGLWKMNSMIGYWKMYNE